MSLKRGEEKYSGVVCDGEGRGLWAWAWAAAGLGTGSGEARLEALRFAWPGLSLENIDVPEGAIAVFRVAARRLSRCCYADCRERRCYQAGLVRAVMVPLSEALHRSAPSPGGGKLTAALLGLCGSD